MSSVAAYCAKPGEFSTEPPQFSTKPAQFSTKQPRFSTITVREGNEVENPVFALEESAYGRPTKGGSENPAKAQYLKKLSPGGRIYFLANRYDFEDALKALETFPKRDTGSALYVKAFCLAGLGKSSEALKSFKESEAKVATFFTPSARFYLHYATTLFVEKKYDDALKYLSIAEGKSNPSGSKVLNSDYKSMQYTIRKRKAVLKEMRGQYREAFDDYLSFHPSNKKRFHLGEPIEADSKTAAKAKKWLTENPSAPSTDPTLEVKFYLTRAKAYLAAGQTTSAIESLNKAVGIKRTTIDINSLLFRDKFVAAKDEASILLVRLYYLQKNFKDACKNLRATFYDDPVDEFSRHFVTLSMKDVAQIVHQSDVDCHSVELESSLDTSAMPRRYSTAKKMILDSITEPDETLLLNARKQMSMKSYKKAYSSLLDFERQNTDTTIEVGNTTTRTVHVGFRSNYARKVHILKLAAGFAGGVPGVTLNPGNNAADTSRYEEVSGAMFGAAEYRPASKRQDGKIFWTAVEDNLFARKSPLKAEQTQDLKKRSAFVPWCHFARGVRALSQKDYKTGASEFKVCESNSRMDKDLAVYSHVLKEECEKQ